MKQKQMPRNLSGPVTELLKNNSKMIFLSGPRQCGKTTLAKSLLVSEKKDNQPTNQLGNYFNWDNPVTKQLWIKNPVGFGEQLLAAGIPQIVLDEFHKNPKWKNQLKGFFDHHKDDIKVIVTGSAKLNLYRKGADSLIGRYFHLHVNPFTFGEVLNDKPWSFERISTFFNSMDINSKSKGHADLAESLMAYGGFPEVFQKQSKTFLNLWQRQRNELLIRQDLRDVSNIISINQVEILAALIPARIGSPLSVQSLVEDIDGSYNSVKKWLKALEDVYYHFELKPFSNSVARSLKKEGKVYLYDWAQVNEPGPRFENMVALHLLKMVHFYNDTGQASLELKYLRNKSKQEIDFILLENGKPYITVEVKLSDTNLGRDFENFHRKFSVPHFQIISASGYLKKFKTNSNIPAYVIGFSDFFQNLP